MEWDGVEFHFNGKESAGKYLADLLVTIFSCSFTLRYY